MEYVEAYLSQVREIISKLDHKEIQKIAGILQRAYQKGKQVFLFGNGGSASTASHISCDLAKGIGDGKRRGFKVIPLTDNIALMSAWANDTDYKNIFTGQLMNLIEPEDIAIGISGSGESENVLEGLKFAKEKGAITIGLTGCGGGRLKDLVQECLIVPSDNMQQIEDAHLIILHAIFSYLRDELTTINR